MYGPLLCPQGVKWSRIVTAIMRPLQCALVMQSNIWICKCIVYQPNAFLVLSSFTPHYLPRCGHLFVEMPIISSCSLESDQAPAC